MVHLLGMGEIRRKSFSISLLSIFCLSSWGKIVVSCPLETLAVNHNLPPQEPK